MLKIENVKEIKKNSLICKFDLVFENQELTIRDCTLMESKGKRWVSMPQRIYELNGEKKYFPYVVFGKDKQKKLEDEVIPQLMKAMTSNSSSYHQQDDMPF